MFPLNSEHFYDLYYNDMTEKDGKKVPLPFNSTKSKIVNSSSIKYQTITAPGVFVPRVSMGCSARKLSRPSSACSNLSAYQRTDSRLGSSSCSHRESPASKPLLQSDIQQTQDDFKKKGSSSGLNEFLGTDPELQDTLCFETRSSKFDGTDKIPTTKGMKFLTADEGMSEVGCCDRVKAGLVCDCEAGTNDGWKKRAMQIEEKMLDGRKKRSMSCPSIVDKTTYRGKALIPRLEMRQRKNLKPFHIWRSARNVAIPESKPEVTSCRPEMAYQKQDGRCYVETEMTCKGVQMSQRLGKPTLLEKYKKIQGGGFVEVKSVLEPTLCGRTCRKGYISVHLPTIHPEIS